MRIPFDPARSETMASKSKESQVAAIKFIVETPLRWKFRKIRLRDVACQRKQRKETMDSKELRAAYKYHSFSRRLSDGALCRFWLTMNASL